jgi:glycosyltransferase involved in cell wall biosynthesis
VIIEWENALNAEGARASRMLAVLASQLEELETSIGPAELLLVFDEQEFSQDTLSDTVQKSLGASGERVDWRLLPAETEGYYPSKNQGARAATGELLLFLDSDVIPEGDWLRQMLTPFEDPEIQLLAGCAYIEPTGLVGKAFALTWFFPLRSKDGPLRSLNSFFANNLVLRRMLYRRYPFPELTGTSRGGCIVLAETLRDHGITAWSNPRARVSHPPPNGWQHIRNRALAQGRDRLRREQISGSALQRSWVGSCYRLLLHWARSWRNIILEGHEVGLRWWQAPAVGAIAMTYYFLYWCGETASLLGLDFIKKIRV